MGLGRLWESPFIAFSLFLDLFPLLLCTFLHLLLLRRLSVQSFIAAGMSAHGTEGEKAPGSLCVTVMRGDVVIQQFLPKGHICSLSFCSPYPSESLVYLSRMHSAVFARTPARPYHPLCINIKWGRDYIPLLAFRLDSRLEVLSLVAECHAVNLQFILKLNCGFVSRLWGQTVLTFRFPRHVSLPRQSHLEVMLYKICL